MISEKIINNILGNKPKMDCKSKNLYKKCEDCNETFTDDDMKGPVCKYCAKDRE